MFHVKPSEPSSQLNPTFVRESLALAGVEVTFAQAERLVQHAEFVLQANQTLNLTRITEPADVVMLHIVDSLAYLPLIEPLTGRVVDIGAGAGYPGIPLTILGHDVLMCESVKKKTAFLVACLTELGLSPLVSPDRAEELAAREPQSAEVVIARALSSLPSLIELAAPLLTKGGRLVALKGTPDGAELAQAQYAATQCGMLQVQNVSYRLPSGEDRSVFVFQRTERPRIKLPRRNGLAQRQPLVRGTSPTQ